MFAVQQRYASYSIPQESSVASEKGTYLYGLCRMGSYVFRGDKDILRAVQERKMQRCPVTDEDCMKMRMPSRRQSVWGQRCTRGPDRFICRTSTLILFLLQPSGLNARACYSSCGKVRMSDLSYICRIWCRACRVRWLRHRLLLHIIC